MERASGAKRDVLYAACQVELGLDLAGRLPGDLRVRDVWPLISGYPFARWAGVAVTDEHHRMLRLARQELWTLAGATKWSEAVDRYNELPERVRGFVDTGWDEVPRRREVAIARERWATYEQLLSQAVPLSGRVLPPAGSGRYSFLRGRERITVRIPELDVPAPEPHDLDAPAALGGEPIRVTKDQLRATATAMDARDPGKWAARLDDVWFQVARNGSFGSSETLTVGGVTHLLGMVGAGKSTLRDILTVHVVTVLGGRVTVVVNDVAEVLKCVDRFNRCLGPNRHAAPVIGASSRAHHLYRLHRRTVSRGEASFLDHQDPGFDHLSVQCLLNPILVAQGHEPNQYGDAPCEDLSGPKRGTPAELDDADVEWSHNRRACPLWNSCGRHESARRLRDADIWVATPASLVDARIPWAQNAEKVHYLEAAARRSDLVIVDEADRVQVQLDSMFAPAITLAGQGAESWIDTTTIHRSGEFSEHARVQLSSQAVDIWNSSMHSVSMIADQLHAKLVQDRTLRRWLPARHFGSWRLIQKLISDRYGSPPEKGEDPFLRERQSITDVLDVFRGNPYGDRVPVGSAGWDEQRAELQRDLVTHAVRLLHSRFDKVTRPETERLYAKLFDVAPADFGAEPERRRRKPSRQPSEQQAAELRERNRRQLGLRFEFFLRLAALEANLGTVVAMWPQVRPIMRLAFTELYRRPAVYGPMVPEPPMGSVLGFQFREEGEDGQGRVRGQLRFFMCSGVGRSLLDALSDLPTIDDRPGTNVILMSGSSWAGSSARYHLRAPVSALITPDPQRKRPMSNDCVFRLEPLWDSSGVLTVSGSGLDERFPVLRRIAVELGRGGNGSRLQSELKQVQDRTRRRALLLVGSYEEAQYVADVLHNLEERWHGRVFRLVSDDTEDLAHAGTITREDDSWHAPILRRGDVDTLDRTPASILVAPLLAVERGHNILVQDTDYAAIGTVYFLARPQPRPDDLGLTVNTVNSWIHRVEPEAERWLASADGLDEGARAFRKHGRDRWHRALSNALGWQALARPGRDGDRTAVTWDLLVLMWQVIGRLVRGGVEARVVFIDAAFAPRLADHRYRSRHHQGDTGESVPDDVDTSLLVSVAEQLDRYLKPGAEDAGLPAGDVQIVNALYRPMWIALTKCLSDAIGEHDD